MVTGNGLIGGWIDRLELRTGWDHPVAAWACPFHEHGDGLELVYHPSGSGETRLDSGETAAFGPGDVMITPPGVRHSQRNTEPGHDFCLVAGLVDGGFPAPGRLLVRRQVNDEYILREFRELAAPSPGGAVVRHYRLRALVAALLQTEPEPAVTGREERYVEAVRRMLRENYTDRRFEIRQAAAAAGISADYLRHLFLAHTGTGPKQYLMRLRLNRVRELLRHSTLTLKEIAALSGFDNERYLCACFRRNCGMTPGEFRVNAPRE